MKDNHVYVLFSIFYIGFAYNKRHFLPALTQLHEQEGFAKAKATCLAAGMHLPNSVTDLSKVRRMLQREIRGKNIFPFHYYIDQSRMEWV